MFRRLSRRLTRKSKARTQAIAQEHDRSLIEAELQLRDLTERGVRAVDALDNRHRRNHWQESVRQVIRGVY